MSPGHEQAPIPVKPATHEGVDLRLLLELFSPDDPQAVPAQVEQIHALLEELVGNEVLDSETWDTLNEALELCRDVEDRARLTADVLVMLGASVRGRQAWSPSSDPASGF